MSVDISKFHRVTTDTIDVAAQPGSKVVYHNGEVTYDAIVTAYHYPTITVERLSDDQVATVQYEDFLAHFLCGPFKAVCKRCGSEDVAVDCAARWNKTAQAWEITTIFDKGAGCDACGAEDCIELKPLRPCTARS